MTNYDLATELMRLAGYLDNEGHHWDAENVLREAARRLRGESQEREPEAMEART